MSLLKRLRDYEVTVKELQEKNKELEILRGDLLHYDAQTAQDSSELAKKEKLIKYTRMELETTKEATERLREENKLLKKLLMRDWNEL